MPRKRLKYPILDRLAKHLPFPSFLTLPAFYHMKESLSTVFFGDCIKTKEPLILFIRSKHNLKKNLLRRHGEPPLKCG
jgi:hypothetical protein